MLLVKYEDLVCAPASQLRKVCSALNVPYDEGFVEKWSMYDAVTGDIKKQTHRKQIKQTTIENSIRETVAAEMSHYEDYHSALERLRYGRLIRK